MSTMSRAEYKSAILAAAESGALKEALEYYHLTRMAFRFVDENAWAATMTPLLPVMITTTSSEFLNAWVSNYL